MSVLIFLSSGLFLGWSHGANNAANVFGTAIGVKMVSFRTAAIITSIFVVLGAGVSGAGASLTLGKLGSVNELAGAFMVALAAAVTVAWMTKIKLPVSTSQAIVGAIIGWNFFSGSLTDLSSLSKIVSSWVMSPILAAFFAVVFYGSFRFILKRIKVHLLILDYYNRLGLIVVGAFGAYSLGANNIANVMGVFVPVSPFRPIETMLGTIPGSEQLFIMGGLAMAAGVMTYSYKVMKTVGQSILKLTPITALVVVLSASTVLFLFASQGFEHFLAVRGLPTIPLVPVSSSQAIMGALIGIGLFQGGRGMNYRMLGKIASGWITTPIIACVISYVSLFIIQNVFDQQVYRDVEYRISESVSKKLISEGINFPAIDDMTGIKYNNAVNFRDEIIKKSSGLPGVSVDRIIDLSRLMKTKVDIDLISSEISDEWFTPGQANVLKALNGKTFTYIWEFHEELTSHSDEWKVIDGGILSKRRNEDVLSKLEYLDKKFWVK